MASEIGAVAQHPAAGQQAVSVVVSNLAVPSIDPAIAAVPSWEAALADKIARDHAKDIPGRTPREIADALLARLLEKKAFRGARNLNHWPQYAPEYLVRLARWMAHERKKEIELFIQRSSVGAYSLALAVTDDSFRADWIVSDTNLELWDGRLREEFYFLAVKRNALDFMEKLGRELETFEALEGSFVQEAEDEDEPLSPDEPGPEPGTVLGQEADPPGTLIQAAEDADFEEQVSQAMKIARSSRKYWWIRQKRWGKALGIGARRHSKVSTKRPARPITE